MHRFFVNANDIINGKIHIYEDAAHISRVLRLKTGNEILVCDGCSHEYICALCYIDKSECVCDIVSENECNYEPKIKVSLFQGIPKSGKMEMIIQKCVELGVYEVIPVITKNTVVRLDDNSRKDKKERWQKIAKEAAKQCGRGIVPTVYAPVDFAEAAEKMKELDMAIMPYEKLGASGKKDLKQLLSNNKNCGTIGIIIGPEGGFDESEADSALLHGVCLVGLGERILRTETVGMALLSVIMYENDEI